MWQRANASANISANIRPLPSQMKYVCKGHRCNRIGSHRRYGAAQSGISTPGLRVLSVAKRPQETLQTSSALCSKTSKTILDVLASRLPYSQLAFGHETGKISRSDP